MDPRNRRTSNKKQHTQEKQQDQPARKIQRQDKGDERRLETNPTHETNPDTTILPEDEWVNQTNQPRRRNERAGQQEPTCTQNRKQEGKEGKPPANGANHGNKCNDPLQHIENQHHAFYMTIQQIGRMFKRLPNRLTISPARYTLAIKRLHTDVTTSSSKPLLEPNNNNQDL